MEQLSLTPTLDQVNKLKQGEKPPVYNPIVEFKSPRYTPNEMYAKAQEKIKNNQRETDNTLLTDPYFIDAARTIARRDYPDEYEQMSEEEITTSFLTKLNRNTYNITRAVATAVEYDGEDVTPEELAALAYGLEMYEQKEPSWAGTAGAMWALASDPISWGSLLSLGAGTAAREGAKQSTIAMIRQSLAKRMTALAAVDGAAIVAADDAAQQGMRTATGLQDVYDPVQGAASAAVGGAMGAGLYKGGQFVGKQVGKFIKSGEEEMARAAGGGTPPDEKDLIVQHNLTSDNVQFADEMGGLAVPSLAVTKVDQPLSGFGEISLLADPKKVLNSTGVDTFGADVYSPRYPNVSFKTNRSVSGKINEAIDPYRKEIGVGSAFMDYKTTDDMGRDPAALAMLLDRLGVKYKVGKDQRETYSNLREVVKKKNLSKQLNTEARKFMKEMGAKEVLPNGKEHTLDNVVSMMKKNIRGGEEFGYGLPSIRAKMTPKFRNMAAIKKAKDKIITEDEFNKVKKSYEEEFDAISEELLKYHADTDGGYGFGRMDDVEEAIATGSFGKTFKGVPDKLKKRIDQFRASLVEMPTAYFEAKVKRAMDLGEFEVAVVPKGTDMKTVKLLRSKGIKVKYYNPDKENRDEVVSSVAKAGKNLLFASPAATLGAVSFAAINDKNKGALNEN